MTGKFVFTLTPFIYSGFCVTVVMLHFVFVRRLFKNRKVKWQEWLIPVSYIALCTVIVNGLLVFELHKHREMDRLFTPPLAKIFETTLNSNSSQQLAAILQAKKLFLAGSPVLRDAYTLVKGPEGVLRMQVDSQRLVGTRGGPHMRKAREVVTKEILKKHHKEIAEALRGQVTVTEQSYKDPWGEWMSIFVPLRNDRGVIVGVMGADLPAKMYFSPAKEVAQYSLIVFLSMYIALLVIRYFHMRLQMAHNQAMRMAKEKEYFTAKASHEFRTPLHGILGSVESLQNSKLSEEQKQFLDMMKSSSEMLLHFAGEILDFSKLDAKKMTLESKPFDMQKVLHQQSQLMQVLAAQKALDLQLDIHLNSRFFIGDESRFSQILLNLLSNAIKYTDKGFVRLEVHSVLANEPFETMRIKVSDSGEGIAQEEMCSLFQPFFQTGSGLKKNSGTGLGLVIAKELCQLMGGTIEVSSQRGVGTAFVVTVPLQVATEAAFSQKYSRKVSEISQSLPLKILVADDVEVNRVLLQKFLERLGYRCDCVKNGKEVLQAFEQNFYDLVFMDCNMPEMDGYQATALIRERFKKSAHSPQIIAVTATADPQEIQRCLATGMNDFISKPFACERIYDVILKQFPKSRAA